MQLILGNSDVIQLASESDGGVRPDVNRNAGMQSEVENDNGM